MIIALTTVMIIVLLVCTPLRVRVGICLNFHEKTLFVRVKVFLITFFKETFTLDGKYLNCQGTVETKVDLTQMDTTSGKYLVKAIVFDSANVTFATNYLAHSPTTMVALEGFVCVATNIACAISNTNVHTSTQMAPQTAVFAEIRLSVSLADVLLALIRGAIRSRNSLKNRLRSQDARRAEQ